MNGELQQAATTISELGTLLLPVNGKQLILPNVSVAEIIPYEAMASVDEDMPSWFSGRLIWRTRSIPVVSFEAINDEPFVSQSRQRRIAVLNGIVDEKLPFCGIVTEGVPRLMRIGEDEIAREDEANLGPAELCHVMVNGERATIPNVDFIQQQILTLL